MKRLLAPAAILLSLAGCNVYREATAARPDLTQPWRAIATDADRDRLRNWRKVWTEALADARGHDAGAMAADPLLFDPDRALGGAVLPPGKYRCRTFKLGASGTAMREFTTYPAFDCEVSEGGKIDSLHKLNGVQRPVGMLFPETDARTIFLGTLILGDETSPLRYGLDARRDMIGYVERIGERRWRLVLPRPHFESVLDIIELVPIG
ncbi:MAG: DUF4893 domain-containing protein [Sphingomonas sp.]|uniref:DUF4893 domain-containing protein n=1 Tax=Sphingomonas sp. TaxID=28214 RepID=UPI0025CE4256|nr:DUF4893 domain-containing protein [Sphingomonas sp.]MBX3566084.1 DUF4893 domain-containing protein [Sphingomonas sp.]